MAVESGTQEHEERLVESGRSILGVSVRGWMRLVVGLGCFLLIASALIWYVAQGLEEKVLGALQPHLKTDVEIGSVDMTFWSSWPDVEVVLNGVQIEDALDKGTPFLSLNSLGVAFDWRSLLMGGMEVSRVRLEGGTVRLVHTRAGNDNWKFWKEGESSDSAPFALERLDLSEVLLEGEWWSPGVVHPLIWKAEVEDLRLDGRWKEGIPVALVGQGALAEVQLTAAGEKWLDGVDLESGWVWDQDIRDHGEWFVSLMGGEVGRDGVSVPFVAGLSGWDGFSMNLGIPEADANGLYGLIPGFLKDKAPSGYGLKGRVGLDVRVGRGTAENGWKGPRDSDWSGEWAVRCRAMSAAVTGGDIDIDQLRGEAAVCSLERGWRCRVNEATGKTLGGEFKGSAVWQLHLGKESVDGRVECVLRPKEVLVLAGAENSLPQGWMMGKEGALRGTGPFLLERKGKGDWEWKEGDLEIALTRCQWDVGEGTLGVEAVMGEVGPSALGLRLQGIKAPGFMGSMELESNWREGLWQVQADVQSVDVGALLSWLPEKESGDGRPMGGVVDWGGVMHEVKWGALIAREVDAQGTWDLRSGEGEVVSMSASVFGGRATATGEWDRREVSLDGRMAEAEIPELLIQTGGLGQTTLLPHHAKGLMWAEGRLGYRFETTADRAWSADLDLRMEGGELVDFDLLQRIPETLKGEARYRLLADADDLARRLRRVRFEPITTHIVLDEGVFSLEPTDVVSDAMDVGISGWQSLNGRLDYTLDFALRDLKSQDEEFGTTSDDGLGHRFFLSIAGTLDEPLFGYDGTAHKEHRRRERRDAVGRLKELISGKPGMSEPIQDTGGVVLVEDSLRVGDSTKTGREKVRGSFELDTDDDFKR